MLVGRARPQHHTRLALRLVLAIALAVSVLVASAAPAEAAITDPFVKVFDTNVNGDIQIRGNTLMTCDTAATGCNNANNTMSNNDFVMKYVNVDSDPATKNSSQATIDLPDGANVLYAALLWGGDTRTCLNKDTNSNSVSPDVDAAQVGNVKIAAPGSSSYTTVAASRVRYMATGAGPYQAFAEVTDLVKAGGDGVYTVGAVQAARGYDRYAGWSLAVAYSDPAAPLRNLTMFRGFGTINNSTDTQMDITVSGFTTPKYGQVRTTLGAVVWEGDRSNTGDRMLLNGTALSNSLNPVNNVFNSTISDRGVDQPGRNPQYPNQLGFDIDTLDADGVLANGSTNATIRVNSSSEAYYPGFVTFATDLYAPKLNGSKTVTDVNGGTTVVQPEPTVKATKVTAVSGNTPQVVASLKDESGTPLQVKTIVQPNVGGTVAVGPDGLTFTPTPGWHGTATFTVTTVDANGVETTRFVTVEVLGEQITRVDQAATLALTGTDARTPVWAAASFITVGLLLQAVAVRLRIRQR